MKDAKYQYSPLRTICQLLRHPVVWLSCVCTPRAAALSFVLHSSPYRLTNLSAPSYNNNVSKRLRGCLRFLFAPLSPPRSENSTIPLCQPPPIWTSCHFAAIWAPFYLIKKIFTPVWMVYVLGMLSFIPFPFFFFRFQIFPFARAKSSS